MNVEYESSQAKTSVPRVELVSKDPRIENQSFDNFDDIFMEGKYSELLSRANFKVGHVPSINVAGDILLQLARGCVYHDQMPQSTDIDRFSFRKTHIKLMVSILESKTSYTCVIESRKSWRNFLHSATETKNVANPSAKRKRIPNEYGSRNYALQLLGKSLCITCNGKQISGTLTCFSPMNGSSCNHNWTVTLKVCFAFLLSSICILEFKTFLVVVLYNHIFLCMIGWRKENFKSKRYDECKN